LTEKNPQIKKAVGILQELSEDEQTRLEAEAREKAWKDEQGRYDFAYNEGIQKGIQQRNLEIAREMRAAGMSDDQIARITGIAPEQL
jgi:predicted transposase/invertase (TIGR01784 family)